MISTNQPFFLFFLLGCALSSASSSYYYYMRATRFRRDLSLLISPPRSLADLFLVFFGFFCGLNLSLCVGLCCVVLGCVGFFFWGLGGWFWV